jgi:hypothetical protein
MTAALPKAIVFGPAYSCYARDITKQPFPAAQLKAHFGFRNKACAIRSKNVALFNVVRCDAAIV